MFERFFFFERRREGGVERMGRGGGRRVKREVRVFRKEEERGFT